MRPTATRPSAEFLAENTSPASGSGSAVLAVAPGKTPGGGPPAAESQPPEPVLAQRLRQLRSARGRRELRPNALLDRVAGEHALAVCLSGQIGHEPQPGRDPEVRLLAAGVRARRVGETVSRAQSAAAAFSAFEHSPSHRLSLLEPGFTDAGYGQARDARGRVCAVILLAEWPRYVGR
jgi:uncharacterized protein YkwD